MTERLWVLIPPVAGHFSLLYPKSSASLIQVPHGGATLLILLLKEYAWPHSLRRIKLNMCRLSKDKYLDALEYCE